MVIFSTTIFHSPLLQDLQLAIFTRQLFYLGKSNINAKALHHRGFKKIALYFQYNEDIIDKVKTIAGIRFSKTHKCWYLPFDIRHYELLKSFELKIDLSVIEEVLSPTRPSPHSPSDNKAIVEKTPTLSVQPKVRGKATTDIRYEHSTYLKAIHFQGGHFFIDLKYHKPTIQKIKSLYAAHWNSAQKLWICKASPKNFNQLQALFGCWNKEEQQRLSDICQKYKPHAFVRITPHLNNNKLMELETAHSSIAVEFVKTIPKRSYNEKLKRWLIPRDKSIAQRIQDFCKEKGIHFKDKVTWVVRMPIHKSRNTEKKLKYLLRGVPNDQLIFVTPYVQCFLREHYSFSTMINYTKAFRRYLYWLGPQQHPENIELDTINSYINYIVQQNVEYQTINRAISAVKFYYRHLCGWSEMRLQTIIRPRRPKRLPKIMSMNEVKKLFAQVDNLKHLVLLKTCYGCGLRSGEVINLRITDIMLDRRQIFIRAGKGNKDRIVMIPEALISDLISYINEYKPDYWLFQGNSKGKPYSSSSFRQVFKRALISAGLDQKHKLHNLRHSFATHLMEAGTQQRLIQKLLGHQNAKTTEIYTHVSRENIKFVKSPLDLMDDTSTDEEQKR